MEYLGFTSNCDISMSDGWIHGSGYLKLTTMRGTRIVRLPWLIDEVGPALLESKKCSGFGLLRPNINFFWIIPAILFFVLIAILLPFIRIRKMKKELKDCGYKGEFTKKGYFISGPMGDRVITISRILLYCYFIISSYTVESCINSSRIVGNHSLFITDVWSNDAICTKSGTLIIPEDMHVIYPSIDYKTFLNWTHKRTSSWGCGGGSCPDIDGCKSLNKESQLGKTTIKRNFCTDYPWDCPLSRGCWIGEDEVIFSDEATVLSFDPLDFSKLNKIYNKECQIFIMNRNSINFYNKRLLNFQDNFYICSNINNRGYLIPGHFGDNQFLRTDEIKFSWDSIKCDESWYRTTKCSLFKHTGLSEECVKLPNIISGVYVVYEEGKLLVRNSENHFVITGSCKSPFIEKEDNCFDFEVELHGKRLSGFGVFLTIKAESKDHNSTHVMKLNCTNEMTIHILCNGKLNIFPIAENEHCTNVKDFAKLSSSLGVEIIEKDHTSTLFDHMEMHTAKHVISISTMLIIIIIILIICHLKSN